MATFSGVTLPNKSTSREIKFLTNLLTPFLIATTLSFSMCLAFSPLKKAFETAVSSPTTQSTIGIFCPSLV
jgi:hypothetical protein